MQSRPRQFLTLWQRDAPKLRQVALENRVAAAIPIRTVPAAESAHHVSRIRPTRRMLWSRWPSAFVPYCAGRSGIDAMSICALAVTWETRCV